MADRLKAELQTHALRAVSICNQCPRTASYTTCCLARTAGARLCRALIFSTVVGYPSGQRGQTVNLLAHAFAGSNPAPTTTFSRKRKQRLPPLFTGILAVPPDSQGALSCAWLRLSAFTDGRLERGQKVSNPVLAKSMQDVSETLLRADLNIPRRQT